MLFRSPKPPLRHLQQPHQAQRRHLRRPRKHLLRLRPRNNSIDMRKYLIAGLLVWIPLVITGWVLKLLIDLMDQSLLLLPEKFQTEAWLGFHVPGMGVFLTVAIVLLTGVIAANFFGKKLLHWWDQVLQRIPIVRSIYSGVKQISEDRKSVV